MLRKVTLIAIHPNSPQRPKKLVYAGEYSTWVEDGDAIPIAKFRFYTEHPNCSDWVFTFEQEEPYVNKQ